MVISHKKDIFGCVHYSFVRVHIHKKFPYTYYSICTLEHSIHIRESFVPVDVVNTVYMLFANISTNKTWWRALIIMALLERYDTFQRLLTEYHHWTLIDMSMKVNWRYTVVPLNVKSLKNRIFFLTVYGVGAIQALL